MRVVFVHGACVRDGSWWWHRAATVLQERNITSVAPMLPSCGEGDTPAGASGPRLADDVAAVRQTLEQTDEATVVVAHSYGGIIVAEAAADLPAVRHLLLISSYLPEVGESLGSFSGAEPAPFLDVKVEAGTFAVRPELLTETFLQDCPELTDEAISRLVPQTLAVTQQPVKVAAWQHLPTTYLVCAQDRGTPAHAQREFARRAGTVVELEASHHPFLSQPDAVADIVLGLS